MNSKSIKPYMDILTDRVNSFYKYFYEFLNFSDEVPASYCQLNLQLFKRNVLAGSFSLNLPMWTRELHGNTTTRLNVQSFCESRSHTPKICFCFYFVFVSEIK